MIKPRKENDTPTSNSPQGRKGMCNVSSLSSAIHYMFDNNLATKIHIHKKGYIECLSELGYN